MEHKTWFKPRQSSFWCLLAITILLLSNFITLGWYYHREPILIIDPPASAPLADTLPSEAYSVFFDNLECSKAVGQFLESRPFVYSDLPQTLSAAGFRIESASPENYAVVGVCKYASATRADDIQIQLLAKRPLALDDPNYDPVTTDWMVAVTTGQDRPWVLHPFTTSVVGGDAPQCQIVNANLENLISNSNNPAISGDLFVQCKAPTGGAVFSGSQEEVLVINLVSGKKTLWYSCQTSNLIVEWPASGAVTGLPISKCSSNFLSKEY